MHYLAAAVNSDPTDARSAARVALGVRRLTSEQAQAVDEAVELHTLRRWFDPKPRPTLRERADARTIAAARASWLTAGYRRAESAWAGGRNTLDVRISSWAGASTTTTKAWSKNGKRTGTDAHTTLRVPRGWRTRVEREGLAVVDGLFTLDAKLVEPGVWIATWVAQARGLSVRTVTGYIVRHMGVTLHAGIAHVGRRRCEERAKALAEERAGLDPSVVVTIPDARAAGLCASGVADWVERHAPGRTSATVGELLALAVASGDRLPLVRLACQRACRRAVTP